MHLEISTVGSTVDNEMLDIEIIEVIETALNVLYYELSCVLDLIYEIEKNCLKVSVL